MLFVAPSYSLLPGKLKLFSLLVRQCVEPMSSLRPHREYNGQQPTTDTMGQCFSACKETDGQTGCCEETDLPSGQRIKWTWSCITAVRRVNITIDIMYSDGFFGGNSDNGEWHRDNKNRMPYDFLVFRGPSPFAHATNGQPRSRRHSQLSEFPPKKTVTIHYIYRDIYIDASYSTSPLHLICKRFAYTYHFGHHFTAASLL